MAKERKIAAEDKTLQHFYESCLDLQVRHSDAEHFQVVIRTYINPADAAVL
jgi:hypothetical protein